MAWVFWLILAIIILGALLWWAFGSSTASGSMSAGTPAYDPGAFASGTAGPAAGQIGSWANAAGPGDPSATLAQVEEQVQAALNGIPWDLANPWPPADIAQNP